MRTLHGVSRHPGVAIAVAVVVNVQDGLSGLPDDVMRRGLRALKTGLPEAERAEVIVLCDLLAVGSSVRIPGVRTVGVIAQSNDEPALPLAIPCISGVDGLMRASSSGEMAILDGSEGVVYLDPDVQTLMHYQSAQEPEPAARVFLESEHPPARTQDGRVVMVAGSVSSVGEAETAVAAGADLLVVNLAELVERESAARPSAFVFPEIELLEMLIAMAGGRPLRLSVDTPGPKLLGLVSQTSIQKQVTLIDTHCTPRPLSEAELVESVLSGATEVTVLPDAVAKARDLIRSLPSKEVDGGTEKL